MSSALCSGRTLPSSPGAVRRTEPVWVQGVVRLKAGWALPAHEACTSAIQGAVLVAGDSWSRVDWVSFFF